MAHVLIALMLASAPQAMPRPAPNAPPRAPMSRDEARQLYTAGGFPISPDDKGPVNRCGKPAQPRVTLVDINRDGRKDALFIDSGACYGTEARWFSLAVKEADGRWRGVAGEIGSVRAARSTSNGWLDIDWTVQAKTVRLRYDGTRYAAAAPPPRPSATGDDAIFIAAGFSRQRGAWRSNCGDPGTASYEAGKIERLGDLNKDGHTEALVTEGGTYCYGMVGSGFWLLSQQPGGDWKVMLNSNGIPEFLATRGASNWPDVVIGGPGFCFPVLRWNGRLYAQQRFEYQAKPCKPR